MTTPQPLTYYIILLPQPPEMDSVVRQMARLAQEEEDVIRRKLETTTYEVLGRFSRRANAEGLLQQVRAFGVNAIMVSDQDMRTHLIMSMATANRGAGGIAFRDYQDKPLYCPFDDIAAAGLLEVGREDGSTTLLIDLYRRSTNIIPRLDADLFDFEKMLGAPGAQAKNFIAEMQLQPSFAVNQDFAANKAHLVETARDFASRPVVFSPSLAESLVAYNHDEMAAANIYSYILASAVKA
ncbi:hypothetical protein BH09SUM1_BH09SUM1_07720 [soil metagenome]